MRPPQKKRSWGEYDLRPGTAPGFVDTLGATESNARIVVEFRADDLLFSHKNAVDTSDAGIATAFVAQNYANRFIVRKTVALKASTKPVAGGMAVTVGSGAPDSINFVGETIVVRATTRDVSGNTAGKAANSNETDTIIGIVSGTDTLKYKADQQNPAFTGRGGQWVTWWYGARTGNLRRGTAQIRGNWSGSSEYIPGDVPKRRTRLLNKADGKNRESENPEEISLLNGRNPTVVLGHRGKCFETENRQRGEGGGPSVCEYDRNDKTPKGCPTESCVNGRPPKLADGNLAPHMILSPEPFSVRQS